MKKICFDFFVNKICPKTHINVSKIDFIILSAIRVLLSFKIDLRSVYELISGLLGFEEKTFSCNKKIIKKICATIMFFLLTKKLRHSCVSRTKNHISFFRKIFSSRDFSVQKRKKRRHSEYSK